MTKSEDSNNYRYIFLDLSLVISESESELLYSEGSSEITACLSFNYFLRISSMHNHLPHGGARGKERDGESLS